MYRRWTAPKAVRSAVAPVRPSLPEPSVEKVRTRNIGSVYKSSWAMAASGNISPGAWM